MKIYTCYTPSHENIYREYFLSSLPDGLSCHSVCLEIHGKGDFNAPDFLQAIKNKLRLVIESIDENIGATILWSDVDILFIHDPLPSINTLIDEHPHVDIWFQKELATTDNEANVGFILMRCTPTVKELFRCALAEMDRHPEWNDQRALNYLLQTKNLVKWHFLPLDFFARTHGWPPENNIIIYHANNTPGKDGVAQKIMQFNDLRKFRKYGMVYIKYMRIRNLLMRCKNKFGF